MLKEHVEDYQKENILPEKRSLLILEAVNLVLMGKFNAMEDVKST
jgi:uncharacterized membrane protein YiaA